MQSAQTGLGRRVVSSVVADLNEGNITHAVDKFGEDFKFTDHALGLEFNDKELLGQFLHKSRQLFPDARLELTSIFESGSHIIAEWNLTATHVELFWPRGEGRVRRSLPGVSVVGITGGRISEWSDYYDKLTARRGRLADFFTEWTE
jgi:steroid delta-isomerase-like uncharacterized protein